MSKGGCSGFFTKFPASLSNLNGIAASIAKTPKESHLYLASTGLNYRSYVFHVFMSFHASLKAIFARKNQRISLTRVTGFCGGIQSEFIMKNPVKKFTLIRNMP